MKKSLLALAVLGMILAVATGCATAKLPFEDVDVFAICAQEVAILHDENIAPNSKQKYDAAVRLSKKVDFQFARDVRTLDKLFATKDAKLDMPNARKRTIILRYTYENKAISFVFTCMDNEILGSQIIQNQ